MADLISIGGEAAALILNSQLSIVNYFIDFADKLQFAGYIGVTTYPFSFQ